MRRVLLSILGTIAGVGALLSFKTHPNGANHPLPALAAPRPAAGASAPVVPSPSSTASGASPSGAALSSAPSSSAPSSSAAAASKTYTGQAVQTRYGIVQIQLVMSGRSITNVSFSQLTADDPRSADINSQAGPILLQQTMQAQGANIDGVSGATFTSEGYLQSLQSALDQAGS